MAKKLTDEERAAREAAKKEAAALKATEKAAKELEAKLKAEAESQEAENFPNMPEDWHERNKIPVEERIPVKVKTTKRFSKVPPTDKDELLVDYNNIQRAMANDKESLAAVEAKYKINNPGDLMALSINLYARITGNEKNVADTQAEIEGRRAAQSKK